MVFRAPKSDDEAAIAQAQAAAKSDMNPAEWTEATRNAAKELLEADGAHVAPSSADSSPPQTASFLPSLWGVESVAAVPTEAVDDPGRVLATVYEIGGPLTSVLSTSVAKSLPLIPHVGIRVHGVEYFYSDHIEYRTIPVMEEMLGDMPRVTLDLGPATKGADEVRAIVDSLESEWTAEDYHVFDKNCVHFAQALGTQITASGEGVPAPLMRGVLDVSERMLDSLPEWRRKLGRRVMNEVTRLVVVSWGRASQKKKEQTADTLGLERGA